MGSAQVFESGSVLRDKTTTTTTVGWSSAEGSVHTGRTVFHVVLLHVVLFCGVLIRVGIIFFPKMREKANN